MRSRASRRRPSTPGRMLGPRQRSGGANVKTMFSIHYPSVLGALYGGERPRKTLGRGPLLVVRSML